MERVDPYAATHIVGETQSSARKRLQMVTLSVVRESCRPITGGDVRGLRALGIAIDLNKLLIFHPSRCRGNDNE